MKKSPTKYELAGDFLAYVKIYLYLCSGFQKKADLAANTRPKGKTNTGIRCREMNILKTTLTMKRFIIMTTILIGICISSCNVTRTVTTKSEYWQKGDTAVTIQTRTVEQYDASKKLY